MSENVQVDEKLISSEVVSTTKRPRPTKETWIKAKIDYETGNYQGMKELADKYNINYKSLKDKAYDDNWIPFHSTVSEKVREKVAEKVVSRVDSFFEHLDKKGLYYEKLVEASQAQASRNNEGIPELEPPDLVKYATVEDMAIQWRKTALGINDKMNVTASLEVNVLSILEQVKQARTTETVIDVQSEVADLKEIVKNLSHQVS